MQQDLVRQTEIGVGLGLQNIERFSQRGQIFGPGGPSSGHSGRLPATFVASTSVQMEASVNGSHHNVVRCLMSLTETSDVYVVFRNDLTLLGLLELESSDSQG